MSKETTSAAIPSCEAVARANEPSLRASGDQGPASSGPAALADLAPKPLQTDSSRQADRESFCLSQAELRIVALILTGYSNKDQEQWLSTAIPHPRLEVREIVSLGAPEAVGQIRIGFVGGGRAGKYPR
jgi:hypothetical protein